MSDLVFTPAYKLAHMIRDRNISSTEVLEAYLNQIAKYNPQLNAIATLNEKNARTRAKEADEALARGENWGVLHGVPITVKDTLETEGLLTTAGYKPLKNYIPAQDATVVARLKQAGAIIMGKSNCAEMASDFQSTNELFGRVNNPWNINYTAGGSSGGSAAAVAAGLSPLDMGNDVSGSVRQPAHFCGVYAFKPTEHRVSTVGHIPEAPGMPKCIRQMMTIAPLARSISDLQLWLSIVVGADDRQPDIPPVALDKPSGKFLKDLRVAWMDGWDEIPIAKEMKTMIAATVDKLANSGVVTEYWKPTLDVKAALQICNQLTSFNFVYSQPVSFDDVSKVIPAMWRDATQGDRELKRVSSFSQFLPTLLNPNFKDYFKTLTKRDRLVAQMDRALEPWDVWLCPVAMTTAFTHRAKGSAIKLENRKVPYFLASGGYTMLFNLTGNPVVVVPIGQTKDGLPMGMQIVGKRWQDLNLLAIAQQLVEVIGGIKHPPGY